MSEQVVSPQIDPHQRKSTVGLLGVDGGASAADDSKTQDKKGKKKKGKEDDGKEKPIQVPFFAMFRFADKIDVTLMVFGSIGAVLAGAVLPAMALIFGALIDAFDPKNFSDPNFSLTATVTKYALAFLYIGAGALVLSYLELAFWMMAGERQTRRVRENYLASVLRQEIGWYDVSKPSEISTKIASDTAVMQEAIGEKVGNTIHHLGTFVAGFAVGFTKGWQLTLVILAVSPLLMICGGIMAKMVTSMTKKTLDSYASAGGVAEECISNMRTLTTFSGDTKESERYTQKLADSLKYGVRKGIAVGGGMSAVFFVMFCTYSLAFYYGSILISNKTINATSHKPWTGGDVVTVFFAVIMGAFAIGQVGPNVQAFASGRASAYQIFQIIDRRSKIDPFSTEGSKPDSVRGHIEFSGVDFAYPSRSDVQIFKGLNMTVEPGKTVALVGDSGGGKSTVIALLERFYDVDAGEIMLDGINLKNLNIKWMRQQIGLVSQEPQLFATTIAENIRYGKENANMDEIIEAAKSANAHDFISKLPGGYETLVGEKGVFLSGGQKQRIAIARAIIKNPAVLLLDEATSALDTENERIVQEAINRLMKGRTTIVIAHRLATVKHADCIYCIRGGQVIEQGTHDQLMELNGVYTGLVHRQLSHHTGDQGVEGHAAAASPDSPAGVDVVSAAGKETETETVADIETGKKVKVKQYSVSMARVFAYSKPDAFWIVLGVVCTCGNGAIMPVFAVIYAEILKAFQEQDPVILKQKANFLALMFLVLAIGAGIFNFFQGATFGIVGERLTYRLRNMLFQAIVKQDIAFFDYEKNSTGVLTTKLATDATMVQGLTTQRLSLMVQNIATVTAGLVIAFVAGWKLTLVILASVPVIFAAGKIQMSFIAGFSVSSKTAYEKASEVSTEAVGGIRTIASFTNENQIMKNYSARLEIPVRTGIKRAHVSGFFFGLSQFCMFAAQCLGFWYGGVLVDKGEWHASAATIAANCAPQYIGSVYTTYAGCVKAANTSEGFQNLMRIFMAIIMSAMGLGQAAGFAPDAAKAGTAASSIFEIVDRRSDVDPTDESGAKPPINGSLTFSDIHFKYPSRPKVNIFSGFHLEIPVGQTIAIVGDSGGGKSTLFALLERFYRPDAGKIMADGVDISTINVKYWRSQIGLVGQEPTLFSTTIAANIKYGMDDATMEQVEAAAKFANAHEFIAGLPNGYHTQLGDKYTQLSGGQKQRVAIARAVIRNPRILLLDEATSALDSASELLVQEALERLMKGRTTLVIAHRLSTIKNADSIVVVKGGAVVEQGTHEELLSANGAYCNLVKRQL